MEEAEVDRQIVARVQRGDKQAFNLLVSKYQIRIAKLVSRFISDDAEVADVTQEAFIKAYRALPNFRGDSAFYTWLYRIAINAAKNHLVAVRRRPPRTDIDVSGGEPNEQGFELVDETTPEGHASTAELRQLIIDTLDGLPKELRTAVVLCEIEGLSYDEIAQAMDCPVGTVRSRIFRARQALEEKIRPMLSGDIPDEEAV
ncbi:MAG: RNA polymerase sigma factor RpoE [Pseudomonadota bacterium]|nr:RNA polymerase sigma factor RpoE [Pseudomonadota bacterium]